MVQSTTPMSPDPAIPAVEPMVTSPDLASHILMYNRVLSVAKFFIIHLAIIVIGLYFFVIALNPTAGAIMFLISIVLLVYGFLRRRPIRDDIAAAMSGSPEPTR